MSNYKMNPLVDEAKVEALFETIGQLKMCELAHLTHILTERLSLRVIGSLSTPLEKLEGPAEARVLELWCQAVDPGQKITAIKHVRATYGLGLKEAKDWVEDLPKSVGVFEDSDLAHAQASAWGAAGFKTAVQEGTEPSA